MNFLNTLNTSIIVNESIRLLAILRPISTNICTVKLCNFLDSLCPLYSPYNGHYVATFFYESLFPCAPTRRFPACEAWIQNKQEYVGFLNEPKAQARMSGNTRLFFQKKVAPRGSPLIVFHLAINLMVVLILRQQTVFPFEPLHHLDPTSCKQC